MQKAIEAVNRGEMGLRNGAKKLWCTKTYVRGCTGLKEKDLYALKCNKCIFF